MTMTAPKSDLRSDVRSDLSPSGSGSSSHRRIAPAWRSQFNRWWVAYLILPMMIASDWKFRRRAAASSLGGSADLQVLLEVGIYGLVALYLVLARGRAPRWLRTTPILATMWAFASIVSLSAVYAVYPNMAIVRGAQVMIVAALAQTIATRATVADMHRFAHGYLMMLCVAVAIGHAHTFNVYNHVNNRFHWLYIHPVPAAIYLMIGTLISLAYVRSSELRGILLLWPLWVYNAIAAWIILALLMSKTRGSVGGAVIAIFILLALHTRPKTKFDIGTMATAFIAFVGVAFGAAILSYIQRGEDINKLSTLNERTNLWKLAFQEVLKRPIFGDGLGASRGIFLDTIGLGGGHNAFVNVMVDEGLLGTVAFLLLLGWIGHALWTFKPGTHGYRDALILTPIFCGMLINSMTAEFMAVPANNASMWLFIFVAWISVVHRAQRSDDLSMQPLKPPQQRSSRIPANAAARPLRTGTRPDAPAIASIEH